MTEANRIRLFEGLARSFDVVNRSVWFDEEENKFVHTINMGDRVQASAGSYETALDLFCKALLRGSFTREQHQVIDNILKEVGFSHGS
jgi:hypothetical protein